MPVCYWPLSPSVNYVSARTRCYAIDWTALLQPRSISHLNVLLETCRRLGSHLHTGHIPANLSSWFLQQPKYDGTKITEM